MHNHFEDPFEESWLGVIMGIAIGAGFVIVLIAIAAMLEG